MTITTSIDTRTAAAPPDAPAIKRTAIDGAVYIPLALLKPSATNPRKRFDKSHLDELAASVKRLGVIQPILARPIAGATTGQPLYEIVAGERRWRASTIAEQPSIPTLLRDMTDFEVLELQVIENLQRDDLHPIEEAEGFHALLRKPEGLQGYANADELAARIGKSRRYVYNRLKLLDLVPAAREACLDGKLAPTVAMLIAGMPDHVQPNALKEILRGWGGEPFTLRQASEHLQRNYMLALDRAPFKITDAELLPAAGSCRTCPKRTGASPDLFDNIKQDTCTDSKCFNLKVDTHRQRLMDSARQQGVEVITGAAAKKLLKNPYDSTPTGYLVLDKVDYSIADKPLDKLLGKDAPPHVLIENPHTHDVIKAVPQEAAMKVLKDKGIVKTTRKPTGNASERAAEAKAKASKAWREAAVTQILARIRAGEHKPAETASMMWPEVALVMWQRLSNDDERRCERLLGWEHIGSEWSDPKAPAKLEQRIRALSQAELGALIMLMCLCGELHVNAHSTDPKKIDQAPRIERFAQHLQVDIAQIRRDLAAGVTEPKAKPSKPVKPGKPGTTATATEPADATAAFVAAHAPAAPAAPNAGVRSGSAATRKAISKGQVPVRYRNPDTGDTWSGRGLQPAWLKTALAAGSKLSDFDTQAQGGAAEAQPDTATPALKASAKPKVVKAGAVKFKGGSINPEAVQGVA